MRALVLLSALSLIGCAHQQVRDDRPLDGAGGGVGLDAPAVATRVMLAGGMGVGGLKSISGGPNEHASQNMTATSITLSAASGANAVGIPTGARLYMNSPTNSRYIYDDGAQISISGALLVGGNTLTTSIYGSGNVPVAIASTAGFKVSTGTLPTCTQALEGLVSITTGSAAVKTKPCVCTWTPTGSVAKWFNALNPSDTTGTTTTCPN